MKELYNKDDIIITLLNEDYYMLEAPCGIFKGYYKRLSATSCRMRLDYWRDSKTNRIRSEKNKLFNSTCSWFVYMLKECLNI